MIIGISGKKNAGKDEVADYISEKMFLNKHILFEKVKFADKLKDIVCLLINCTRGDLEDREFKEKELGEEWVKYELRYTSYSRLSYGNCPDYYEKYFCSKEEAIEYIEGDLEVDQDSIEISKIELTPRLLLQLLGTECGRDIIHPNIWVNATFADYQPNGAPYNSLGDVFDDLKLCPSETKMPNWIISDVRFPNEAKAIKDKGGILIRVDRDFTPKEGDEIQIKVFSNWSKVLYSHTDNNGYHYGHGSDGYKYKSTLIKPITDNHFSETALDSYQDWDFVINNDRGLPELWHKVDIIISSLLLESDIAKLPSKY